MLKAASIISRHIGQSHVTDCTSIAVIAITDPGARPMYVPSCAHPALHLQFDDVYEEIIDERVGAVPDADPDGPVLWYQKTLPDAHHAGAIIKFITSLPRDQDIHLLVHSHPGIGRSAAVAEFIHDRYGVPITPGSEYRTFANQRLVRLLNKVSYGREIIYGKFVPGAGAPIISRPQAHDGHWLV